MISRNQHSQQELSLILLVAISFTFLLIALGLYFVGTAPTSNLAYIKLAKFSASLAIYAATMLWLLKKVTHRGKLLDWAATAACIGAMLELTTLLVQASYHGWQTGLLVLIGRLAILLPTALIVIVFRLLIRENIAPALRGALLWATGLALFGCLPGLLMLLEIDKHNAIFDSLRLAHFVGLHALQVMPLAYFFLEKQTSVKKQILTINLLGFSLLFLIAMLTSGWLAIFTVFSSICLAISRLKTSTAYSGKSLASTLKQ